jgi:predicted nucleic acid-binding protein
VSGPGLLIDGDVLAAYLEGAEQAGEFLEFASEDLAVAASTAADLHARARNDAEHEAIDYCLAAFRVIAIDGPVARRAGEYRRARPDLAAADALVAACAGLNQLRLVTLRRRAFPMLDNVLVPWRSIAERT